jgi:RimJ/RimL family protein N-acetyltransferase
MAANAWPPWPALPLQGENVLLRAWSVNDAEWYVSARDDEIFRWTSEPRHLTVQFTREAIDRVYEEKEVIALAIVNRVTGALAGDLSLNPRDLPRGEGEVSYWLAPEARKRGFATEAVSLLTSWAFGAGFYRIILRTKPGNERSQAVALRCGFVRDTGSGWPRFFLDKPAPKS